MTFEVEVNGRFRVVAVEPVGRVDGHGGRFRLTVRSDDRDAVTFVVDARRTDQIWSIVDEDRRRVIDAAVTEGPRGAFVIQLPHVTVAATVDGRRFRSDGRDEVAGSDMRIVAPMPGRVVRLLVKPGDAVSARQALVVVEAMKMENALAAPRSGRVVEVAVAEGQPVEAGRVLVRLE